MKPKPSNLNPKQTFEAMAQSLAIAFAGLSIGPPLGMLCQVHMRSQTSTQPLNPEPNQTASPTSLVRVQGSGFMVQESGFRVQGSQFRVQGSGIRPLGPLLGMLCQVHPHLTARSRFGIHAKVVVRISLSPKCVVRRSRLTGFPAVN